MYRKKIPIVCFLTSEVPTNENQPLFPLAKQIYLMLSEQPGSSVYGETDVTVCTRLGHKLGGKRPYSNEENRQQVFQYFETLVMEKFKEKKYFNELGRQQYLTKMKEVFIETTYVSQLRRGRRRKQI